MVDAAAATVFFFFFFFFFFCVGDVDRLVFYIKGAVATLAMLDYP